MKSKEATSDECIILLQAAIPEIYRGNAFRISGLSVNATTREITTQLQKNQLLEKYGNKAISRETPFPIVPTPDADQHRLALHRLRDPETRILDEFFWFWPHDFDFAQTDKALEYLSKNNIASAEKTWIEFENLLTESNVSRHNLAVLSHLQILDKELSCTSLSKDETNILHQQWIKTFKRWKLLIEHEGFWRKFSERIVQMNDPRMTTGFVQEFRESLPLALLLINANLALKAAEKKDIETAKRHLSLIMDSGFGKEVGEVALRKVVEPIRNRIKIITKSFADEKYPDHVGELEASQKLIDQTKALLEILDILLSVDNSMREVAHDEVALEAMYLAISSTNATNDYEKAIKIYEQLVVIVISESARQKINGNYETIKKNIKYDRLHNTCFFCQKKSADEEAVIDVDMHGEIQMDYILNKITWKHIIVKVPRCKNCKKIHGYKSKFIMLFIIITNCIGGYFLWPYNDVDGFFMFVIMLLIVGSFIGGILGEICGLIVNISSNNINKYSDFNLFPDVSELLMKRWGLGEEPPSSN